MDHQMSEVKIETIRVVGRFRKDLGNTDSLAQSIKEVGLLHPIVVTTDMELIAGNRRLAACRSLGRTTVPAMIVNNLDDAILRLKAERDENIERKDMTITEKIALGEALETLERPKAAARRDQAPGFPQGEKVCSDRTIRTDLTRTC